MYRAAITTHPLAGGTRTAESSWLWRVWSVTSVIALGPRKLWRTSYYIIILLLSTTKIYHWPTIGENLDGYRRRKTYTKGPRTVTISIRTVTVRSGDNEPFGLRGTTTDPHAHTRSRKKIRRRSVGIQSWRSTVEDRLSGQCSRWFRPVIITVRRRRRWQ